MSWINFYFHVKNSFILLFLFRLFHLFLLPFNISLAICNSISASKATSVSCLISGIKSPSLAVRFLPFLNGSFVLVFSLPL